MKIVNAFILASIRNAFIGFIGIIIGLCIWETGPEHKLPPFVAMNLINLFLCFLYGLFFLLPLATWKKEQIRSNNIVRLFKQYLPFIVIIPAAIFTLIFFNHLNYAYGLN